MKQTFILLVTKKKKKKKKKYPLKKHMWDIKRLRTGMDYAGERGNSLAGCFSADTAMNTGRVSVSLATVLHGVSPVFAVFFFFFGVSLTWNITKEVFAEVPLRLPLVPVMMVLGPPRLLVAARQADHRRHISDTFMRLSCHIRC